MVLKSGGMFWVDVINSLSNHTKAISTDDISLSFKVVWGFRGVGGGHNGRWMLKIFF